MVLWQHSPSKLQHFFLQHKGISMPSQTSVRVCKIAHGNTCKPIRVTAKKCESSKHINLTYLRMVIGIHALAKLQHFFSQHKSILVPCNFIIRICKIAHVAAYKPIRVTTNKTESSKHISLTYLRMVLGQHSSSKLQHLFSQHKGISMPSELEVRE
jgi:hypothetical protein